MMAENPFDDVLSYDILLDLAGERYFERGENYYYDGQVRDLIEHERVMVAKVLGSYEYRVRFRAEEYGLSYSCDCPVGLNGEFCKHCVAVGLAWLKGEAEHETFEEGTQPVTMDDVKAYLEGQEKDALIGMLVEQAMEDERLRERLLLRAARVVGGSPNIAALRRAIDSAMEPPDDYYWDYDSREGNYAQQIDDVVRSIRELAEEGFAAQAIELSEYALEQVEKNAMEYDVDGEIGIILEELQDIHHAACEEARPDPKALAARLFAWEMHGDHDTFHGAARKYADVLGEEGLAEYRRLVEEKWAMDSNDWRLTNIMRSLARASGDIEEMVAIERKDLSSSRAYLRIAHIYHEADEPDQALEWAEEGVRTFPDEKHSELHDFLAERYHERGRHEEAMELAWARFTESPNLEGYRRLKEHAGRAGGWESWREKALSLIRENIAARREKEPERSYHSPPVDHSELVRIFLWERDVETAWREAKEGGCSSSLWMELAVRREEEHPEDALPIYRARIEPTIEQKNNQAYENARELLVKVRKLMKRVGQEQQFDEYLDSIRTEHKRKRNLMKLLKSM